MDCEHCRDLRRQLETRGHVTDRWLGPPPR